jgi:hypothetical protein
MHKRPRKAFVRKERIVHVYAELWHASKCVLEVGKRDATGATWQFLSSSLLTAFAFEAYLNHVGAGAYASQGLTSESWATIERLSPLDKYDQLRDLLQADGPIERGQRPLQTIVRLFDVRNKLAHGKTVTLSTQQDRDIDDQLDDFLGQRPLTDWETLMYTSAFCERARSDVESVLKRLHAARPDPKEALFTFGIGTASGQGYTGEGA